VAVGGGVSMVARRCERRRYCACGSVMDGREFRGGVVECWNAKGKDGVVVRVFEEL
jgi:hypothetical protein